MTVMLKSPHEITRCIADNFKAKRLADNLGQKSLAERAGVSYSVVRQFERSGKIALTSLLKLALILNLLSQIESAFIDVKFDEAVSLDALLKKEKRKRGRL
jgi:transcriptional regulator with XRE-family HTH domain